MGSSRRDELRSERYRPYKYQSNANTLVFVGIGLAVWVVLALFLAWSDISNVGTYQQWKTDGMVAIPPTVNNLTQEALDKIFAYSEAEGLQCTTIAEINASAPDCDVAIERSRRFSDSENRSLFIFVGLIIVFIATVFPFSTFVNRASRNLLALKSADQKFSPEWAVLWFYIPIMNAVRPIQVLRELFKGSDETLPTDGNDDWRRTGHVPLIMYVWWPLFVASLFFNPILVPRVWSTGPNISGLISATKLLFWSDLLLALTGIAAFLMLRRLHLWQVARHAKVGDLVVTRPRPKNPFAGPFPGTESDPTESANGESR